MTSKPKRPASRSIYVVLFKAWMLILGVAIAFGLAGLAASLIQKPVYEATTTLYLTSGGTVASSAYDSVTSSTQRVGSYAQLIYSQAVLMPAANAVGLDLTLEEARKRVGVDVNPAVVLMTITVQDTDPSVAQRFADALAQSMQDAVSKLEVPGAASEPLVKIRQVTKATLNASPVKPTTLVNVSVAVAVGLIAGCLLALVRESRNNRVRDENDAEVALGAPVLTVVGADDRSGEPFRTVRTRLLVQDPPVRKLLVTAPTAAPTSATATINIGKVLAKTASSVVVVDADLARPVISRWAGCEGQPGLVDVLRGSPVGDVIRHGVDGLATLAVLGAGSRAPGHPADFFSSAAFRQLLGALAQRHDYVIVKSAAMLADPAAESILPFVDGVLVVGGPTLSTLDDLAACRARMSGVQARVIGLVYYQSSDDPKREESARPEGPRPEPTNRNRHARASAQGAESPTPAQ